MARDRGRRRGIIEDGAYRTPERVAQRRDEATRPLVDRSGDSLLGPPELSDPNV